MTQMALSASHLELTELNVLMAHRQCYSLQTPEQKPKACGLDVIQKHNCTELMLPIKALCNTLHHQECHLYECVEALTGN